MKGVLISAVSVCQCLKIQHSGQVTRGGKRGIYVSLIVVSSPGPDSLRTRRERHVCKAEISPLPRRTVLVVDKPSRTGPRRLAQALLSLLLRRCLQLRCGCFRFHHKSRGGRPRHALVLLRVSVAPPVLRVGSNLQLHYRELRLRRRQLRHMVGRAVMHRRKARHAARMTGATVPTTRLFESARGLKCQASAARHVPHATVSAQKIMGLSRGAMNGRGARSS